MKVRNKIPSQPIKTVQEQFNAFVVFYEIEKFILSSNLLKGCFDSGLEIAVYLARPQSISLHKPEIGPSAAFHAQFNAQRIFLTLFGKNRDAKIKWCRFGIVFFYT